MENAEIDQVPKTDVSISLKQDIPSTHALGLQDLYKAAFSQEPPSDFNHFNHKTAPIAPSLIDDATDKFFVGPDKKIQDDLDKNSNFDEGYQLYTLKGLQYPDDFVKPEDATLDLNYDPAKEGPDILASAVETPSVVLDPTFHNDSNSVLDLDKGIQIHLVKAEEMAIAGEQNECNFEACEYTGDAQILHRYLCDTALIKPDGSEPANAPPPPAVTSFTTKQNNNVQDKFDSESVGVNPEVLGVRFEDCDFNSSDSFASTESIIPKNIKCPKCPKKFMFKSDLLRHDKHKHSVKPKLFCKYCNKQFVSQQNLFFHEKSHKTIYNSFQCDTCKKAFKKSAGLVRHVINKHSNSVPFSCAKCDKFFATQSRLRGHFRKVHKTEEEKPYKCDICPKSFDKRQGLSCHAKAHIDDYPYVCQHCSKAFSKACYLKNHLKSHAMEDKETFACGTCGKEFKSSYALDEHGRKHTGEKPFTCSICMKRFAYKAYLRTHIKKHSEVRPHSCAYCQKTFVTLPDLKRHERTHSGNPSKCAPPPVKTQETCTQTVDDFLDAAQQNVTLQNVNVIVDQPFDIHHPIVLTSIGSFIDSNSIPVILAQNPTGP